MPRKLPLLLALLALLCAAPLHAQDDAPARGDAPLVGTWVGLTMDGEALEEDEFVLVFNADGTGTINEGGDRPEPFTYTYDAEAQRCVIFFDGDEDDAFPIGITFDGDTATFAPEGEEVLVARRVVAEDADDDPPAGAIPPPPAPVDTSDSPLLGRWMLVQFNGEQVPDGLIAYDHRADGTGQIIEEGEPGDAFGWDHDLERGVVTVQPPEGETMTFHVVLFEDLAIYFSQDHGGMRIVHRRMPVEGGAGDDAAPTPAAAPMVGEWEGVSNNGEPIDPDDSVRLVFHADGSGDLYEDRDESDPFTWSYDAAAEACTITSDGDRMKFHVSFDGDTMTFESEDGDKFLVMRRIMVEEGDEDADGDSEDELGDADFPGGPTGTWYLQHAYGEWLPADEEVRFDFQDDGTLHIYENGDEESERVPYAVVEERRVIQFFEEDGGLEIQMEYALFDDVMVLDILVPEEYREDFGLEDGEQMQMVLSRLPGGNEEHRRMRTQEADGHPVNGDGPRSRARRMQSATQLRGIHQGLVTYSFSNRGLYPDDLGVLLPDDFLTAEYLLAPWSQVEVPEDIDEWSDEDKAEWSVAHTSYAFALAGRKSEADAELVALFELPLFEATETITVCFEDSHIEMLPYDEADELIEEQTGRDLMGWMEHLGREQIAVEAAAEGRHDNHDEEGHDHD